MSQPEVVIVSACRTPIGGYLGTLLPLRAADLGGVAVAEAVRRAGVEPAAVQECIMGNVVPAGQGQNPGRQAALKAGLPDTVNAFTINKVCGSGLKAVMLATQAIKAGDAELIVAGGMESMSNAPHVQYNLRGGVRMGDFTTVDALIRDGLWCAFNDVHMGNLAEYTAEKAGLTREELDAFAADSQRKAGAATAAGAFAAEIVPVEIPQRKGAPLVLDKDEAVRPSTTAEVLAKLRPAFQKDGIVTAGNAPGLTDGASAVVVASRAYAEANGLPVLATIREYAAAHRSPKDVFFAPIDAVRKVMELGGHAIGDFDLIEANEAFASQCLADGKELGWDWGKVNVNGGAIALGHPIGASGARILTTLLYAMQAKDAKRGLATLCLGGGGAVAMVVEREG
ncbi:MAG TPA: acetyl-CoA C-acetyltransferase [Deferrisomatales bacterium]|nr:acetyl-CoA C-acetyltransferase [Deferrisomatales bacterium]